jgi:uncharacterized protein (TIGR03086 family)
MTNDIDPRPMLHRAFDQMASVVPGVRPEQREGTTPCTEFDVETLVGHIVGVGRRIAAVGRGEPQEGPAQVTGLSPDAWAKAFDVARQESFALWEDDSLLGREMVLPFATLPGVLVAQVYTMELAMHSWDLATATGQLAALDPAVANASLSVAEQMVPVDVRGGEMPFEAVVAVPAGASAYDRLAGYLGRTPA